VKSVIGDLPWIPGRLDRAAAQSALKLCRPVLGDEFFLLGELELDAEQPARRALELEGLTAELVLEKISDLLSVEPKDVGSGSLWGALCHVGLDPVSAQARGATGRGSRLGAAVILSPRKRRGAGERRLS